MSNFYVGNDSFLRCRASLDLQRPDTFSGLPIEGGKPESFTGTVEAVDPNRSSSAHGREWRIAIRDSDEAGS